jgi:hypothetical protein
VPVSSLPAEAFNLTTYAPDATRCIAGHAFYSEADTILPEDDVDAWDYFLCRRCVEDVGGLLS